MKETRWSRERRTLMSDAALAALMAVLTLVPILLIPDPVRLEWAGWLSLLMCASLVVRRGYPLISLAVAALAGAAMVVTLTAPMPALLCVPIVVYSVGRYRRLSGLLPVIVFGIAASLAGPISWTRDMAADYRFLGRSVLVALCACVVALAYLSGRYMRERVLNATLDREIVTERFTAAQRQNEQASQLATGRARAEVAQELHDVLAHSLSVIVVQAEGAKALTGKRPEAAEQALGVIADTGRRSITEVRRIVSLMRGETESPRFGPAPTLSQIPELIAVADDRISLDISGEVPIVPESLGLAAFRVVQEAITNFLKHAGATASATVSVAYRSDEIDIAVRDDGIGSLSKSDGRGSGLAGMRERVAAMGGTLTAGPRAGGGYEVKARLPMPRQLGKSWLKEARR